jgi:hypothetical protein
MKRFATILLSLMLAMSVLGCVNSADVASQNLSTAADNFEVNRRIVFYNGITGEYILTIEGLCSKGNNDTDRKVSFTCKTSANTYKKHYLGVSDNVTYFMEQIEAAPVNTFHYRVTFKPSVIVPDIRVQ